jgi:hypothetical protein
LTIAEFAGIRYAPARRYTVKVGYDGTWPDSEQRIWDHLTVSVSKRR